MDAPFRVPRPDRAWDGTVILKDLMVPMRDGVRLSTDVYLPARDGQVVEGSFPTLLGRTSYDKEAEWLWIRPVAKWFVPRGYAVVLQDIRGRHSSEGKGEYAHVVNPREGPDGHDTVEWIAAQPWSNGRVGTVGVSHGAVVQAALALHRPPHLAAMWLDDSFWNWFTNGARQGGALELDTLGMMFLHGHDSDEAHADPVVARAMADGAEHLRDWVARMPLKRGASPLALIPSLERVFFDYYERGDDSEYAFGARNGWRQDCINFEAHLDRFADVPAVIRCGWYDIFAISNAPIFARLQRERRGPIRLIYGPWVHNACERTYAGDVEFGLEAALDHNALRLRWFDRWLKGARNGVEEEAPVRIFVMGGGDGRRDPAGRMRHGGRWRDEREWPLARTEWTPFYFHGDGELGVARPGAGDAPRGYAFDPGNPVPTISANVASYYEHLPVPEGIHPSMSPPRSRMRSIVQMGASDQVERPGVVGCRPPYGPLAARPDVLVFQTPPLERDLEVTGPLVARLWVSSDGPDTDFTAKLVDVHPPNEDYPQGYAMNLADGIRRARYRAGYARGEPMQPGQVYELEVDLGPTSNLFKAGHRIRVDLSSSNFPRFDVNPNTGEPLGRHTHTRVARNTVYVDAARPSHILLPVIP
jgi:putative CocE/NonD family hydrolase